MFYVKKWGKEQAVPSSGCGLSGLSSELHSESFRGADCKLQSLPRALPAGQESQVQPVSAFAWSDGVCHSGGLAGSPPHEEVPVLGSRTMDLDPVRHARGGCWSRLSAL